MPYSARCKKCGTETSSGALCPRCGGKLGPWRCLWRTQRIPVLSWSCWNAPMRIMLPALAVMALAAMGVELTLGGWPALERLMAGSFPLLMLSLVGAAVLLTGLVLLLRGREVLEIAADKGGLTVTVLLPKPGAVSLLARLHSPAEAADPALQRTYGLFLEEKTIPWKSIRRVGLWPEKQLVLFYAPAHWLRAAVPCDRASWPEMRQTITDKLGKQKHTRLPDVFRPAEGAPKKQRYRQTEMQDTVSLSEIEAMNAEAESQAPEE
ncbi:MAG: zinc ribbon domain-containing protein [Clostridia bacterium]|nr:zinc ribbon domain-containing protein [Clostridia bacterium]